MMTFRELLQKHKDAIVGRWFDGVLATYPGDAPATFKDQKNQFANPVGHNLRIGTQGIFEALLAGADAEKIRPHLDEIIRIRAVQKFSASDAIGFIFRLKEAVRAELAAAAGDPRFSAELTELERQIDRVALIGFDLFVGYREQVCELRINEVKRRVSWTQEKKMDKHGSNPALAPAEPE